jgi:hypothetical protein
MMVISCLVGIEITSIDDKGAYKVKARKDSTKYEEVDKQSQAWMIEELSR